LFRVVLNHSQEKIFKFGEFLLNLKQFAFLNLGLMLLPEAIHIPIRHKLVNPVIVSRILKGKPT
jgi:hypothetical protein